MDKNKALIIPVTLSLKKDYLENAINILNNISDQKKLLSETASCWNVKIAIFFGVTVT